MATRGPADLAWAFSCAGVVVATGGINKAVPDRPWDLRPGV